MEQAREFQGKNLDAAIGEACRYFNTQREQLVIEILHDAKTGIFGIVGTRKAAIKAKPAHLKETVSSLLGSVCGGSKKKINAKSTDKEPHDELEGLPQLSPEQARSAAVQKLLAETMSRLLEPIIAEPQFSVDVSENRLRLHIECGKDSGLLIGREGQTLIALQYLATRILSRKLHATVHLQLDAGEYRKRQESRLRDVVLNLVNKVRKTGRSVSTKPLSAYDRKLVHLMLQNEPDLQARSVGDGEMRRVIVMHKRGARKPAQALS